MKSQVEMHRSSKGNTVNRGVVVALCFFLACDVGAQQIINVGTAHLRNGTSREWLSSPEKADSQLVVQFNAQTSTRATVAITQLDMTQVWNVLLNDKLLGKLVQDENAMVTYFECPAGVLNPGQNTLIIKPQGSITSNPDDITVSKIAIYNKPLDSLLQETAITIRVKEKPGHNIPSRLTILNEDGVLQPVYASPGDTLAIRTGVIYSGTGNYTFSLPAGKYKIYASRGFEYGVDSIMLVIPFPNPQSFSDLPGGTLYHELTLTHEVILPQYSSIDTHIHTLEYSGHGDASMKERVLTIAGEGLNYAVITEHNKAVDITDTVKKMKMEKWFKPVRGDELTTKIGHFNIFPLTDQKVLSPNVIGWNDIAGMRKSAGNKVVILNHARDIHSDFRPSDTMFKVSPENFPANAMEVMNSGSQQANPMQLYRDWMMLMKRGVFLTPIGSSDSHDVSRFIVGQARTYVRNDGSIFKNLLNHRAGVSFGLFTELFIDSTGDANVNGNRKHSRSRKLPVIIKVYAPSWIKPEKISLYVDGENVYTSKIRREHPSGLFSTIKTFIARPASEAVLVAIAEGPDPKVPWWPIAKPYQHTTGEFNPIVLGISEPVIRR